MFEDALLTNIQISKAFEDADLSPFARPLDEWRVIAKAQHLATLKAVAEAAEKGMPICPPMNDREDIVVSLTNQRQACIDWLKKSMEE